MNYNIILNSSNSMDSLTDRLLTEEMILSQMMTSKQLMPSEIEDAKM